MDFEEWNAQNLYPIVKQHVTSLPLQPGCHVLDIGCASGTVTHDVLLPVLPETSIVHAIDVNQESISNAKEKYKKSPIRFSCLDALDIASLNMKFDLIVSFFCFQSILDQLSLWTLLRSILREGGAIVAVVPTKCILADVLQELNQSVQYSPYLCDLDKVYASHMFSKDLAQAIEQNKALVQQVFPNETEVCSVKIYYEFRSRNEATTFLQGINPFQHRMDDVTVSMFTHDWLMKILEKQGNKEQDNRFDETAIVIKIKTSQ